MNKRILLLLLLCQACLGPGIFKEKPKLEVPEGKGTFNTNVNFVPFTETYNPLPNSITINFEPEIDMSTVSLDDIAISATGSCPSPIVMSSSIVGHAFTILLDTIGCSDGNEIKTVVSMSQIFDTTGKAGVGSFTQKFKLDTQSAMAPMMNLLSGTYNSLPSFFTFLLDSSIDLNSVTPALFDITGTGSCLHDPYVG